MAIHLRQICLVASDLDKTIDDLTTIFGVNSAHVDPGVLHFGLTVTLKLQSHQSIFHASLSYDKKWYLNI